MSQFNGEPQATASAPDATGHGPRATHNSHPESRNAPAASPVPRENGPAPIDAVVKEQEIQFAFGDRTYRIRGLERNHSYDRLKVNVLVSRIETFHVDTFDLYQSRPRAGFVKHARQAC